MHQNMSFPSPYAIPGQILYLICQEFPTDDTVGPPWRPGGKPPPAALPNHPIAQMLWPLASPIILLKCMRIAERGRAGILEHIV